MASIQLPNITKTLNPADQTTADLFYAVDTSDTSESAQGSSVKCPGIGANAVEMARIGDSTYFTVNHMQDLFHSSGWVAGGTITDGGGNTVNVAAGNGFIRNANSRVAPLFFFDWDETLGLSVPSGEWRFVGVEYNSGSPQVVVRIAPNWNNMDEFGLGGIYNNGTKIHIQNLGRAVGDHANNMISRMVNVNGPQRDNAVGGLILSETGTRNIIVSSGVVWQCLSSFAVNAVNTSTGSTFSSYLGAVVSSSGNTQWDNQNYNNGGVLTALSSAKYANLWWYLDYGDSDLICQYGQNQYNTQAEAEAATSPAVIPNPLNYGQGILIARTTFQKGASTFASITSAFTKSFTGSAVATHNNLGGLQGGTTGEYYHTTSAQNSGAWLLGGYSEKVTQHGTVTGTINMDFAVSNIHTATIAASTSATFTISNWPTSTGTLTLKLVTNSGSSVSLPTITWFDGSAPSFGSGLDVHEISLRRYSSTDTTIYGSWRKT